MLSYLRRDNEPATRVKTTSKVFLQKTKRRIDTMTTSLSNYLSAKKKTYMILIVAALVVYLLVSLTGVRSYFWYTLLF